MPRVARKEIKTPFIHVMVQGINKEYIFYKDEYIESYLNIIKKEMKNYDFQIIAYCMMNNHGHFLVYTEDIKEFGKFMHKVNLLYSQMYNRAEERCGVLFRNRYQAEPIKDEKYLINCINYIHENPVKANIVKKCEDYKYSSYTDYKNNVGITQNKIIKDIFGNESNYIEIFKQNYARRFMGTEKENKTSEDYIRNGINEFLKNEKINLTEIFSNEITLIKLIHFLKEECNLKYIEIRNFFTVTKGKMDELTKK